MSDTMESEARVRLARRIGMSVVVVVIAWTVGAVTIGVLRGVEEHRSAGAQTEVR